MRAEEFNRRYPIGAFFIYQPCKVLRGGKAVKTVGPASDFNSATVVEINKEPYFANTGSLTPAG
ncbi:hypothetical protein QVN83_00975 [Yersinia frederiksenii]|uniref:hypothetical protein n=1 Tax=Yersinia frederiksenii TaxID=29484 RepID=UPI0025AAF26B|nr:hypothetical protein [Yersinia frederiksenii]MDN0117553.1 hypothetical protein [Yersinia frederiksenii]